MESGFTLIEFVVVMAIITIMAAAFVLGAGQQEKKTALIRSARTLAQDLREIEEMVMSSRPVQCSDSPPTFTRLLGFYFRQLTTDQWDNTYIIFADCDSSKKYNSGQDVIIKEVTLEEGVRFRRAIPPAGSAPNLFINIVFEPPDPIVYINTDESLTEEAVINICLESNCPQAGPAEEKTVRINTAGRIEIE